MDANEDVSTKATTPDRGYSVTLTKVDSAHLAGHLESFLQRADVWGLVERLETVAWLRGQANGIAQLYRLATDQQTRTIETLTGAGLVTEWPVGRLFAPSGEWRWRVNASGSFAVLGLSETRMFLETGLSALLDAAASVPTIEAGWQVTPITQHLVGSIIDETDATLAEYTWREVRNPHPLLYPLTHGKDRNRQPRVQTYNYTGTDGVVRFTRFRQLAVADIQQEAKP